MYIQRTKTEHGWYLATTVKNCRVSHHYINRTLQEAMKLFIAYVKQFY